MHPIVIQRRAFLRRFITHATWFHLRRPIAIQQPWLKGKRARDLERRKEGSDNRERVCDEFRERKSVGGIDCKITIQSEKMARKRDRD